MINEMMERNTLKGIERTGFRKYVPDDDSCSFRGNDTCVDGARETISCRLREYASLVTFLERVSMTF
jgi:hypothetical protein